jgi:hypothetical protein
MHKDAAEFFDEHGKAGQAEREEQLATAEEHKAAASGKQADDH